MEFYNFIATYQPSLAWEIIGTIIETTEKVLKIVGNEDLRFWMGVVGFSIGLIIGILLFAAKDEKGFFSFVFTISSGPCCGAWAGVALFYALKALIIISPLFIILFLPWLLYKLISVSINRRQKRKREIEWEKKRTEWEKMENDSGEATDHVSKHEVIENAQPEPSQLPIDVDKLFENRCPENLSKASELPINLIKDMKSKSRHSSMEQADSAESDGADSVSNKVAQKTELPPAPQELPPSAKIKVTYAVSYAWRGESVEAVEALCKAAETRGINILRDVTHLGLGEKITQFMTSLAEQDRVFVILSNDYLRSENCMFELSEIWRLSRQEEAQFHEKVRVFRLPDARIYDFDYQLEVIEYWEEKQREFRTRVTALMRKSALPPALAQRFSNLKMFSKHAGEIVPDITKRLQPKTFQEFLDNGFQ